jgi:hypothetical protein
MIRCSGFSPAFSPSTRKRCRQTSYKTFFKFRTVLKSTVAICGQSPSRDSSHLSDAELETAATVKGILEVPGSLEGDDELEGDDDLDPRESIDHHLDLHLVFFAKKYDMKSILDAIKPHLFGLVISFPPAKVRLVLVAAALRQRGLCRRLVITGKYQPELLI